MPLPLHFFFFFNDTATTEIYTLSLHDALPIYPCIGTPNRNPIPPGNQKSRKFSKAFAGVGIRSSDRKSTRLNSSHTVISYAVFCLKKKNTNHRWPTA